MKALSASLLVLICLAPSCATTSDSSGDLASYEGDGANECRDGADNDADGAFDCDDEGCAGSPDCAGAGENGGTSGSGNGGSATGGTSASGGSGGENSAGGGETAEGGGFPEACKTGLDTTSPLSFTFQYNVVIAGENLSCIVEFTGNGETIVEEEDNRLLMKGTWTQGPTDGAYCEQSYYDAIWTNANDEVFHAFVFTDSTFTQLKDWYASNSQLSSYPTVPTCGSTDQCFFITEMDLYGTTACYSPTAKGFEYELVEAHQDVSYTHELTLTFAHGE